MPRLPEDTHFYPTATRVTVQIPEQVFWTSEEDGTLDLDRYQRACQYVEDECKIPYPNATVYVHSSDDYGDNIEGVDGPDEIWAYEYLSWIVQEALDIE